MTKKTGNTKQPMPKNLPPGRLDGSEGAGVLSPGGVVQPPDISLKEITVRAVVMGLILGIVFGAANVYLGLRVGMTVSSSIPAAVMTVALFKLLRMRGTIHEVNISQTVASESTALATGTVFTIPALFMWGIVPPTWQIATLAALGGLLGVAAMVPLRRLLIVESHRELPYPEGTACAEVLKVTTTRGVQGAEFILFGILVGAIIKLAIGIAILTPGEPLWTLPLLPKAEIGIEVAPAILGVGFILGFRQSGVILAGAAVSALVLTPLIAYFGQGLTQPLLPETKNLIRDMDAGAIWSRYIRYIGAGAVALAGFVTVASILPSIIRSFGAVVRGLSRHHESHLAKTPRTDRDLPPWALLLGIVLAAGLPVLIPGILAGPAGLSQRIGGGLAILFFGILFVTVAARIVGLVGVTSQPTSGVIILTLLGTSCLFLAMGWTGPGMNATVVTIGTIVGIAASKSGDASQDMKTGWLIGATPARQQFTQLLGIATACWAVAIVLPLMHRTYTFGSEEIPAPQANLMKLIVDGVLGQNLPWGLVLAGAGLSLGAILCGVGGLPFAIGVYLPFSAMAPVFIGGCVRALADKAAGRTLEADANDNADAIAARETNPGILAASGLVAGEGLAGIAVVIMRFLAKSSEDSQVKLPDWLRQIGASYQQYIDSHKDPIIHGTVPYLGSIGNLAALALVFGVCVLLYHAGSRRPERQA